MPPYRSQSDKSAVLALWHKFTEAFSFVLFVISSTRSSLTWMPALTLVSELFQLSSYLISPWFRFGPLTASYMSLVASFSTNNNISLLLFNIQFWGFALLALVVLVLTAIIMRSYHARTFRHVWALRALMLIAFFLKLFTSSSIAVFLVPLTCLAANNQSHLVRELNCTSNWIQSVVALVAFVVTYGFLVSFSFASYTFESETAGKRNWVSVTDVKFRIGILLSMFLIVLMNQVVFAVYLPTQAIWLAVANQAIIVALSFILFTTVPYHSRTMNKGYGGMCGALLWMATCAVLSVISDKGTATVNMTLLSWSSVPTASETRWIDVGLLLGLPCSVIAGVWKVEQVLTNLKKQALWIHEEVSSRNTLVRPSAASVSGSAPGAGWSAADPDISPGCPVLRTQSRDHRQQQVLDDRSQDPMHIIIPHAFVKSTACITIIVRILNHLDLLPTAVHLTRLAASTHSDSPQMQFLFAWTQACCAKKTKSSTTTSAPGFSAASTPSGDPSSNSAISAAFEAVARRGPGFGIRFLLFRRKLELEQMAAAAGMMGPANSRATEQLNILQYVELQRALSESQRHHIKCITAIQGFWALFLTGAKKHGPARLSFSAFQQAVMAVIQHTEAAQAFYQELLDLYPSAIPVQKAYADFARLVLNDYDIADKFDEMVRISKQREEELTRAAPLPLDPSTISGQVELPGAAAPISTLLGFSKVAVITMNGTGVIESVNEAACGVFGYSKSRDLRGRKINTLMPWPYRLFHDSWLERYRVTGEAKLLAKPRDLWGLHSNGWSFPLRLQVVETKIDSKSPQFTGLVTPSGKQNTKTATLLINNQGIIQMATQQMQTIFGYLPGELVGRNISLIMPNDNAMLLDSGQSMSIGRNAEGVTKSGCKFPLNLRVVQEAIGNTTFFVAEITDVRSLVGEATMSSDGTILDCNADLLTLFGHTRETIVGKPVSKLMPAPYDSFHELFVSKYQRTRKPTLVSSPHGHGKLVPAQHNDGSVFPINIHARPLHHGAFRDDDSVSFHATIRRVTAEDEAKRREESSICIAADTAATITLVGSRIIELSGATNSERLLHQPVSKLLTPLPMYPDQRTIRDLLTELASGSHESIIANLLRLNDTIVAVAITTTMHLSKAVDTASIYAVEDLRALESLVTVNSTGMIIKANIATITLLGYSMDEILDQPISRFLLDFTESTFTGNSATPLPARFSATAKHQTGATIPIYLDLVRLHDSGAGSAAQYLARVTYAGFPTKLSTIQRGIEVTSQTSLLSPFPTTGREGGSSQAMDTSAQSPPPVVRAGPTIHSPLENASSSDFFSSSNNLQSQAAPESTAVASTANQSPPESNAILDRLTHDRQVAAIAPTWDNTSPKQAFGKMMRFSPSVQSKLGLDTSVEHSVQASDSRTTATEKLPAVPSNTPLTLSVAMPAVAPSSSPHAPSEILSSALSAPMRKYSSLGRQPVISPESGTGLSDASQSKVTRESRMILTWKAASFNPLHRFAQRRIQVGFVIMLLATAGVMVTLTCTFQAARVPNSVLELVSLFDEISLHAELIHFCQAGLGAPNANVSWARSICAAEDSMATLQALSGIMASAPQSLFGYAHANVHVSAAVHAERTLTHFISPDPTVATKITLPDFYQVISRAASAANATAAISGDPTSNRDWRFLVTNKAAFHYAGIEVAQAVSSAVQERVWLGTVVLAGLYSGSAVVTMVVFFAIVFPGLYHLHIERTRALSLLLQVPRSVVTYLVNHVYALDDDQLDTIDDVGAADVGASESQKIIPAPNALMSRAIVSQLVTDSETSEDSDTIPSNQSASGRYGSLNRSGKTNSPPIVIPQTISVSSRGPRAIKPFLKTTVLCCMVSLPMFVGLGSFHFGEVPAIRTHLSILNHVFHVSSIVFAFPSLAFEGLRSLTSPEAGSNLRAWNATQLQGMETSTLASVNAIYGSLVSLAARDVFTSVLMYPYSGSNQTVTFQYHEVSSIVLDFSALPARLRNVNSSRGLTYVLSEVTDAMSTLSASANLTAGTGAVVPVNVQRALATAATRCLSQGYLGLKIMFRFDLLTAIALVDQVSGEAATIYGVLIAIECLVFWLFWLLQRRMRNEIRQHCVLLLMIPAGYLRAQRPIMAYIRDICSQLRQYYPDLSSTRGKAPKKSASITSDTPPAVPKGDSLKRNIRRSSIAPPTSSALTSLSRTPVGGGQVGTLTRNGGAVGR